MSSTTFTVIEEGSATGVAAVVTESGNVFISPADVAEALGWHLGPEGFCRGDACYPMPPGDTVIGEDGVNLAALASLLQRPVAIDTAERAAFLGTAAGRRAEALATLEAPDFTLPDLAGVRHSLSDYRGKKILLAAYASW
jgi:AhpC/TSA family